jgi:hypothetical protein
VAGPVAIEINVEELVLLNELVKFSVSENNSLIFLLKVFDPRSSLSEAQCNEIVHGYIYFKYFYFSSDEKLISF